MNKNTYTTHFAQVNSIQSKLIFAFSFFVMISLNGIQAHEKGAIPEELLLKKEAPNFFNVTDGGLIGGSEIDYGLLNPVYVTSVCPTEPGPYAACTPPASGYLRDVVISGNTTWASALSGINPSSISGKIKITGSGTLTVVNSDLKLSGSNALIYIDGIELIVNNGNFILETGAIGIINNAELRTSGNIQQQSGLTHLCITNTEVEVGDEQAGGTFNTTGNQSTSANFQNNEGKRYLKNVCMNVTHDYFLGSGGNGEDILIDVCAEIGDRGLNHVSTHMNKDGDDSGDMQNDNVMKIYRSEFQLPNGNFSFQSGSNTTVCDVEFKTINGNWQVSDTIKGEEMCVWVDNSHNFENNGTAGIWLVDVDKWRAGFRTGPMPGIPAQSSATDVAACFQGCNCMECFIFPDLSILSITDVDCNGASTGAVDISVTGGFQPYTYSWNNGATTQDLSNVPAGAYTLTVTDANGCENTVVVIIGEPAVLLATAAAIDATCNGYANGSVNLTVSGGTLPYSYNWSNGATSEDLSNVGAGTYTVTVTDAKNCTATASTTVTEPGPISIATPMVVNAGCNGNNNGSIDISVSGGTSPYSFSWSNGATTEDISGLTAGTYTVTVTDANGCTATASATVNEPTILTASAIATDALCNGDANGSIDLTVSGGTTAYTYSWSNGATTEDISGLTAGTYTVTVTDANGCTATASATVTEPAVLTASASATDALCNGDANGSIDLTVGGGTTAYSYSWSNGATTEDISGLTAGTYTVTVTDANGCTATASATVNEPAVLTASAIATDALCNGDANGSIDLTVGGGTTAYTYSWSNGATTEDISGLTAGTYTVTVTDANGCTATASATVNEPAVLTASATATDAGCNGFANGAVDLTVNGGTTAYSFAWSNGATTEDLSGVGAGTYTVTITDANGCTATASATVGQPGNLTASATATDATCNGYTDGAVDLTVSGGTLPYGYSWNTGATTEDLSGVGAGTYTVTVTDGNGCVATASATVNEPAPLDMTFTQTNVSCFGDNDGSATVTVTGGTGPYAITWNTSPTQSGITANGLTVGTYTASVVDANGCTYSENVTITEPPILIASAVPAHVTCFGFNDGAVDLTIFGGTAPFSVSWTNGATTEDLVGVVAGTYTATIIDANGCQTTATTIVTQPAMVTGIAIPTNVTCFGFNDASVNLTPMGGTPPYTFNWNNGATTEDLTNVVAGIYFVTITDGNGCTGTASATITQPTLLATSSAPQDVTCNQGTDGQVTLTVNGGTTPYSFSWSNGATTRDLTTVGAGTYTVTVTDANGCTATASATVNEPAVLTASAIATDALCNGDANGSVDLTVGGGTTPYSYSWSNAATSEDISGLTAGTYTVTVTDANGCTATAAATVNEPAVLTASATATDAGCNGFNNGTVDLTVTGGTTAYSFSWSNGATTEDLSNVGVGTYTVTITDANGCTATASATVGQPSTLAASATATDALCNGDANGAVDLTVTGGTTPFGYSWSNSATTEDLSGLTAGTYTVTVTDANGCIATASATVNEPPVLTASAIATDALCNGDANGSVDLTVGGGTAPYTYSWSNGATTEDISGLTAGTYTVTVTDANGCTATASATVNEPAQLTANATATDVLCQGDANGSVDLTVNGGTAPYSYSWSNTATTQDISGLTAGTYTVTVTDANGCTATAAATVTEPAILTASAIATDALCNGDANGSVDLTVGGGTAPYSYAWSNNANTQDISGLTAGTYTVTVTDANGCTATAAATVTEPAILTASATATDALCNGDANGSVDLTVGGGTAPYSYAWSNSATAEDISGLTAGTYTVTVTDANGCTATASATVNEPAVLTASAIATNALCNGDANGSVDLTVGGGTAPYSYNWSNGASTQDISGLTAGTYTVTVTDANGCTATAAATVNEPAVLTASATAMDAGCNGFNNGSVDLTVSGGTTAYSFSWSNGATTEDLNNVGVGTYTVTITDANGCTATASATVGQPSTLAASAIATDALCNGDANGSVDLTVTGGTTPFGYSWSNGATTEDISGVTAGTYNVTVTDANGCIATASATVNEPAILTAFASATDALCNGDANGSVDLTVGGGTAPYSYSWSNAATTEDISGLTAGTYTVTVTDANGCTANASAIVNEPAVLTASAIATDALCNGDANGSIDLTVGGGTTAYSYSWSNGATTEDISGLTAGTYTVTVTDANGCTATAAATVNEPAVLTASAAATDAGCNGFNNGSVDLTVNGGTTAYSFSWSNGATTEDLSNVGAGTYTVTVTDANGCTATASATVGQPGNLMANATATDATCNGYTDGSVDLTVTGGILPYAYSWNTGATTEDLSGVGAGTYNVTVTDGNGCVGTASATVNEPAPISLSFTKTDVSCFSDNDGSATVTVNGGTGPYTITWNTTPVQTGVTANGLTAGTYTASVVDAQGCTTSDNVTINEPALLTASAVPTHVTCFGFNDGAVDLTIFGGTAPFSVSWTNGATTEDLVGVIAGTYTATVIDANGCQTTATAIVTQPAVVTGIAIPTDVTCFGFNNGSVNLTPMGGTPPYTFNWSNGATTEDLANVVAGIYFVTITDGNGCIGTASATITQPNLLTVSATPVDVSCNQGTDGEAILTVNGGTTPYSFSWSNGATTRDLTGVGAGTYSVTVTDANGCTATAIAVINEPILVTASATGGMITCVNPVINLTGSSNIANASYAWTGPNNFSSSLQNPSVTVPGLYNLVVTNPANGCTGTASAQVTDDTQKPDVAIAGTGLIDCISQNAILTGSSNTNGVTYSWSGPNGFASNVASITVTVPGTYILTVTNPVNGCSDSESRTVNTQPCEDPCPEFYIESVTVDANCNAQDGRITIYVGGAPNGTQFNYLWNTGATTPAISGISAGVYTVAVSSSSYTNCDWTAQIPVGEIDNPDAEVVSTGKASCTGNGFIQVNILSGTGPFTISWTGAASGSTTAAAIGNLVLPGLPAGDYQIRVVDNSGTCEYFLAATILRDDSNVLNVSTTSQNASCGSANGSISVSVTGGTAPYTYALNGVDYLTTTATSYVFTGLVSGNNIVTVKSANGCEVAESHFVGNTTLSVDPQKWSATNAQCASAQGTISFNGTGLSTETYAVVPVGGFTPIATTAGNQSLTINAIPGEYYVRRTSSVDNCVATLPLSVMTFDPIRFNVQYTDVTCANGPNDGTIAVLNATGGLKPYSIEVKNTITNQVQTNLNALVAGLYTVKLTDANGCSLSENVIIEAPVCQDPCPEFTIQGTVIDANCGMNDGRITIYVGGAPAGKTFNFSWNTGSTANMISGLGAGVYSVIVTSPDYPTCEWPASFSVGEINGPEAEVETVTPATCTGNGSVTLEILSGTAPWSITYSGAATGTVFATSTGLVNIPNLVNGNYEFVITDASGSGCTYNLTAFVPQLSSQVFFVNATATDANCGNTNGAVSVNIFGGSGNFNIFLNGMLYASTTNSYSATVPGLTSGGYNVTVEDQTSSCAGSSTTYVGNTNVSIDPIDWTAMDAPCAEDPGTVVFDGTASPNEVFELLPMNGFNAIVTTPGNVAVNVQVPIGKYVVRRTSSVDNCVAFLPLTIEAPEELRFNVQYTPATCLGNFIDGTISVLNITGGVAPFTIEVRSKQFNLVVNPNGIPAGDYTVKVIDALGCSLSDSVTVDELDCASLGDFVWEDLNADGIQDTGEPGIPGVTVNLIDVNGNQIKTTTTGLNGEYSFPQLDPGEYKVEFVKPAGYLPTDKNQGTDDAVDSDADPVTGKTVAITLDPGEDDDSVDAGYYRLASLGNFVWEDNNTNGIQDPGEQGIPNVTVKLLDANGNLLQTTTTGPNGLYSFTNLEPGDYIVKFEKPTAYDDASPRDQGTDDTKDSDANIITGRTGTINLVSGENDDTNDAGFFKRSGLGDFVWDDLNENGIQDSGEPGVQGVTVKLFDSNGNPAGTDITDINGEYLFENLLPGTYYVEFANLPAGYQISPQDQGTDDTKDSDADPNTGSTAPVTLAAGETNLDLDAGIFEPSATLGDFVWKDLDEDGIQDGNEPGVQGVTATLFDGNGNQLGQKTTNANGFYLFEDLAAGDYYVTFSNLPNNYTFTAKDQGTDDTADSDADTNTGTTDPVSLAAKEDYRDLDAGIYELKGSIGDFVWNDLNQNGIQDTGEPGVQGVRVILTSTTGGIIGIQNTDANGNYLFTNLTAGTYNVAFTNLPAGFVFSPQDQGTDDAKDSDVFPPSSQVSNVTLAAGEDKLTIDAGIYQPKASLGDFVWEDLDEDGIQDNGEPGVQGVTATLYDVAGNVVGTDVTDANGEYLFENLNPGTYYVGFSNLPTDYVFSPKDQGTDDSEDSDANTTTGLTPVTTLTAGENERDIDAGIYLPKASLGDFVWEDLDEDGIQDVNEPGVQGVTVTLRDGAGNVVGTDVTDANGQYLFEGLLPGTYYITLGTLPNGFTYSPQDQGTDDGKDSDVDNSGVSNPVTLAAGENNRDLDAGIYEPTGSIGDFVWNDVNEDGIQDANEPGVQGVTVTLFNALGTQLATTTTNSNGEYLFDGLLAGNYRVVFTNLPTDFVFSPKDQGTDDEKDSDANTTTGSTPLIGLASGEDKRDIDAGIYMPKAKLGDFVWEDLDEDGIQDANEPGVQGVTVTLYNALGFQVAQETTDANGAYLFTGLFPGDYFVGFSNLPTDYTFSPMDQGTDDTKDSDPNDLTGLTATVTLAAGETNRTLDAGIYQPKGSIGDYVWRDLDKDGIQDVNEAPGVQGVTVTLYDGNGTQVAQTTTNGVGYYLFDNVPPGNYSVGFTNIPTGYVFSPQDQGNNDSRDSDPNPTTGRTATFPLAAGEDKVDVDAGIYLPVAELGDFVWEDLDEDGIQDAGEPGVQGVTVTLFNGNGNQVSATTTNANGFYLFGNLNPGSYYVVFSGLPTGYEFSPQDQGTDDEKDSDANTTTGRSQTVTLAANESNRSVDAGIYLPKASLGDFVWDDIDEDGIQDANEPGLQGVTVTLYDGLGNQVSTTTTNTNGEYLFDNLTPGNYYVVFTNLPTDYVFSPQNQGTNDAVDSDANPTTGQTPTVTLAANEDNRDLDAGLYIPKSAIGNRVWHDLDKDGIQDSNEPGRSGVTVKLLDASGNFIRQTTTNTNGFYLFDGLLPGNYYVEFSNLPTNFVFTNKDQGFNDNFDSDADRITGRTDVIVLPANTTDPRWDAGIFIPSASIGDFVFDDVNEDGVQDAGEPGIPGVIVILKNTSGVVVARDTTDANGNYLFDNLNPGTCTVTFTNLPTNYSFSPKDQGTDDAKDSDVNPSTGTTAPVTVAAGETNITIDAGAFIPRASLGDYVWNDVNNDGLQSRTERGVQGITVTLFDGAGNQQAQTTTGANGFYLFDGLLPGNYYVVFSNLPTGYIFSPKDQGNDGLDSDADPVTGRTIVTNLIPGEDDRSWDAGIYAVTALGNYVWNDLNEDGIQDANEPPIAGAILALLNANGNVIATDTSDANGNYLFENLAPGTYTVTISKIFQGLEVSDKDQGTDDEIDSDFDRVTYNTQPITLVAGEINLSVDLGLFEKLGEIGDYVWNDLDRDGIQDANEIGVPGVTVRLLDGAGNQLKTALTDANGAYLFDELRGGDYMVEFSNLPGTYVFTAKDQGTDDTKDSDADSTTGKTTVITLAPKGTNYTLDAGIYLPTASLGDLVWEDDNENGIQDIGEPGVGGVTVTLYAGNGTQLAQTTTNNNGEYLFDGLQPGDYYVVFSNLPTGFEFSPQDKGTLEAKDSDANPTNGQTAVVTLTTGQIYRDLDAGIFNPDAKIGDFVWNDLDEDGIQDPNEPGIPGVTVTLYDCTGQQVATTVTNSSGFYQFDNLKGGDYAMIMSNLPNGYIFSPKDQGTNDAIDSDVSALGTISCFTLSPDENKDDLDAGAYVQKGSIGDFVWEDLDEDGIQDPNEPGVQGITVKLHNCAGAVIATDITDANGGYLFENVIPGSYYISFSNLPTDYVISPKDQGANDALDSDADANGRTTCFNLSPNEDKDNVDAGIYLPKASLGDFVWDDTDEDGIQDVGEPGIAGVTVKLFDNNGNLVATTTTSTTGYYLFDNLTPGSYYVEFSNLPTDFVFSPKDQGASDAVDSDANNAGVTAVFTLSPGEDKDDLDAGAYLPKASLGDFVWEDLDEDGIQDANEPGLSGITVTLYNGNGNQVAQTTTGTNGGYLFDGLFPGDYYVTFSNMPTGYQFSPQDAGNDNIDSDADPVTGMTPTVTLLVGETNTSLDAGLFEPTAVVGDKVFEDDDEDGVQDPNEPGMPNIIVRLYDCTGTQIAVTLNNANGIYEFTGVPAGDYYVAFQAIPAGYIFSPQDQGTNDAVDSDANGAGLTACFHLNPGEDKDDVDAGIYVPKGTIGDYVWEDTDKDGIQDPNEPGISGTTVKLYTCAGVLVDTETTDVNGAFLFENVLPGSYYVQFTLNGLYSLYDFSPKDQGANDALDSDVDATGKTACFTLNPGEDKDNVDAGVVEPVGKIGDRVWDDIDEDGIQDPNEPGVQGVTVLLYNCTGALQGTAVTDANGNYEFTNVLAGSYYVSFANLPTGYIFSPLDQGTNDAIDNDAQANGQTACFTLGTGEDKDDVDAGIYPECRADAGTLTAVQTPVSIVGTTGVTVAATPNGDAVIPAGYAVTYFLVEGPNLTIQRFNNQPTFTVGLVGQYKIHAVVYDSNPASSNYLDLSTIVIGTSTLGDIITEINLNGLCASVSPGVVIDVNCNLLTDCIAERYLPGAFSVIFTSGQFQGSSDYVYLNNSGRVRTYADGTVNLSGTIVNKANPALVWEVDVWGENRRDWGQWSGLDRLAKGDTNTNANMYQTWDFYEIDSTRSIFAGQLANAGDTLYLDHRPTNYLYGLQIGQGANDKTGAYGLATWFNFTSKSGNYFGTGDFNQNMNCTNVCNDTTPPLMAAFIMLEGAYNASTDHMTTTLNNRGIISAAQPYNLAPWNYFGNEVIPGMPNDSIVDWVLLELRNGADHTQIVERRAAFINHAGELVDIDGYSLVRPNIPVGIDSFYLSVIHRNHLTVMSNRPVSRYSNVYHHDFTSNMSSVWTNPAIPNTPMELNTATGRTLMLEGDETGDAQVNSIDLGEIMMHYFSPGYIQSDINLDGVTNSLDVGRAFDNYFKKSHAPD